MPLMSGPLMAKFIEKYGCKKMTAIGGSISCVGFIFSTLCNSVEGLYLTIGFIGGAGLSAAYIVGLVSVERWFKARRSLAIGIVSAGTGFGTFVLPPLVQIVLNSFGWKIAIFGLSALIMLLPIIAVFLDDPPWKIEENQDTNNQKEANLISFNYFLNRNFMLLSFATFLVYAFFNTAIYFLPELLEEHHLEDKSGMFTAVIGLSLMFGMVILGMRA